MTRSDLISLYQKSKRVVRSCMTMPQLRVAETYVLLVVNHIPTYARTEVLRQLQRHIDIRRHKLRRNMK